MVLVVFKLPPRTGERAFRGMSREEEFPLEEPDRPAGQPELLEPGGGRGDAGRMWFEMTWGSKAENAHSGSE